MIGQTLFALILLTGAILAPPDTEWALRGPSDPIPGLVVSPRAQKTPPKRGFVRRASSKKSEQF